MKVSLLDLQEQYQSLKSEIAPALAALFQSQQFVLGEPVARLEEHLARYHNCRYAVGLSSGTDALLVALMALGIGRISRPEKINQQSDDEVIVPTFTFFGTAGSIARVGAIPVFVDIDPVTFNIDAAQIPAAITERTKAIIPVHLFGQMADMESIRQIAKKNNLAVIEDAAQAIGSEHHGKKTGNWGKAACLSFYPSKNLAGFGDGGMILCNDDELDQTCRYLRMHGEDRRYYHSVIGGNFRLDALQALVLDIKLKYLDEWVNKRRRNAQLYEDLLTEPVQKPQIAPGNTSVFNQYVIRAPHRDMLQEFLRNRQIGSAIYYPLPLHLQECFAYLGGKTGDFPVAEQAAKEVLALPIYPELRPEQIEYVAKCINEFYGG